MQAWIDTIIAFIERHHFWAPWIMVVFAAAETTAFLSILVPSTAILVAVGALAATGAIDFLPLWAGATAGALIGSTFSFWLGLRYGSTILRMRPLSNHPEMAEKARAAFHRYGPATVFVGHFVTVFRPVVFLLAGMSGMTLARFAFWNTLGATAWAFLIPKLGQFGGDLIGWLWSLFA
ncbi:DedA family protein [Rhodobacter sp. Har01]|uniref:DedA family protein n=1 Tax=Rhodobacter sp. Har01 TaxID=2883999 RepID=UPI001D081D30|nr:DedA family protein [Rhodobacter sp. Har01]MCB6177575.1 DedA family protein [Rhodobacter sp. Har01]